MASRKAPKHFFEPWVPRKDSTWDTAWKGDPPGFNGVEPERAEEMRSQWLAARDRAERDADWLLWGSRLSEAWVGEGLFGDPLYHDGSGIVAKVRKLGLVPDGSPSQEDIAKRVGACVNACAGISDPEGFIDDVRGLLLAMCRGETDRGDVRVTQLLARCIPPGQTLGDLPCESD